MTRGTRVGTTIVGFLMVFGPVTFAVSPMFGVVAVAATLVVGAGVLLAGHLRDARHPDGGIEVGEPTTLLRGAPILRAQLRSARVMADAPLAEVISLASAREALAEPPAAGRLAIVTELGGYRRTEPPRLPVAR